MMTGSKIGGCYLGDHKSCKKTAQNVARPKSCPNKYITFTVEKASPKLGLLLYIIKKLPKERNRPIKENSSNL
jgi:hypothetical protein